MRLAALGCFTVLLLALAGCAANQAHESTTIDRDPGPASSGPLERSDLGGPRRLDLHCTLQSPTQESECYAKGGNFHVGPPLICRGVQVSNEVREQEREAYESAVNPCTCFTSEEERECAMVP